MIYSQLLEFTNRRLHIIQIVKYITMSIAFRLGSFDNVYLVHKNSLKQMKQVNK